MQELTSVIHMDTANGLFKPFLDKGLTRPFIETNAGLKQYGNIVTFQSNPAKGDRIFLRNIPFANQVRAIKVMTGAQIPTLYSRGTAYTVPTADGYAGATLVLKDFNNQNVAEISLGSAAYLTNQNRMIFADVNISWQNSYVKFLDDSQSLTTSNAFLINIYYQ